ncbi:selenocysteine-specific translation elongation factor [Roseomonas sp. NAR14]|uniref:Selenocysteine-specific elongation factor n=1 Tax=Roseomonas acroporae TaxID=2937791 RepID=A0A9X1YBL3_9PROT|nr:selenocysteine-specific translation elongation factor [Roseomonas acroporae]MCK8787116.1 selenocysteine-specific translation elongation factor [Roseomonas acroporae]
MIVGTAGHIDHGKTALVRALTGVDTDRLKEEKARGITIELGFAYLPLGDATLGFVDVPGHERFVHTMLAGAGGIDFALLVVAADDGVMPQTREHLAILDLLGIERGIVALSKADLADAPRRAAVATQIRAELSGTGLATAPILPVSTLTGEGIEVLRDALARAAAGTGPRGAGGAFRLAVDRCFVLAGAGTVVTGTVLAGAVAVGEQVLVSPSGLPARVRSLHAQNRPAARGVAGQRCALNLAGEGVGRDAIARGDMVLDPALHAPADRIDARFRALPGEPKPLGTWFPARLHHGSAEVGARLVPLDGPIGPGGEGRVQLVLDRPIAACVGDRFILRDVSAQRTIGGGRFLDLRAPARKRRTPERLAQLDALALSEPDAALAGLLALPPFHVDLAAFGRDHGLTPAETAALAERLGLVAIEAAGTRIALSAAGWDTFRAALADTLARHHEENPDQQGLGRERLRLAVRPRLPAPAFLAALAREAEAGALVLDGTFVRLPGHEVRLNPADEALYARIAPLLGDEARFRPPRVRDLVPLVGAEEPEVRRVLKLCARLGRVDQIAHDHFFLRATTAEMVEIARDVADHAEDHQITAAAFRDRMDNGRKVAIQILDFLDRHGVTLRRGDLRRMNPHRLDLFRSVGA